jgi:hypothetical protein
MDTELFFKNMAEYNEAIFPAQIVVYAFAALFLISIFRGSKFLFKVNTLFIAFIWAWNGIVQQGIFFSQYHPQYYFWGIIWLFQAVLIAWYGLKNNLEFRFNNGVYSYLGLLFIAYALIIYPTIGALAGHPYPRGPIFGVAPCPTVIFTFGSLLFLQKKIRPYVMYFPLLWAIMGLFPVIKMGVLADIGEILIGIITFLMILRRNKRRNNKIWD